MREKFPTPVRPLWVRGGAAALCLAALALCGCGARPSSSVSGKVTLNGQAVSGDVVFVGSDNKQYVAPIGT